MNAFYCVFKKEFFKHFQKKFYLSIFLSPNITEKNFKIVDFQVSGTHSFVFNRKSNFQLFIAISKFKFYFFSNFVDEVCPQNLILLFPLNILALTPLTIAFYSSFSKMSKIFILLHFSLPNFKLFLSIDTNLRIDYLFVCFSKKENFQFNTVHLKTV